MSISKILLVVEQKLPLFAPTFAEARRLRPQFLCYATPAEVLAALKPASSRPASERYALTAALVAEHQERPHALWSSLLLVAFAPMLNYLRASISRLPDEEVDHRVMIAFLEALARTAPDKNAAIALRRATASILFPKEEHEPIEQISFEDEQHSPADPFALTEAELRVDAVWFAKRAARLHVKPPIAAVRRLPRRRRRAA